MNKNSLNTIIIIFIIYIIIKFIPYWNYILYPINLIVTFLHEFWHAFFALITGWSIKSIKINTDWSWLATTIWWIRWLVIIWWYIWSAIFWNILLYYSIIWKNKTAEYISIFLWLLMIFSAIIWFSWIISSLILITIWAFIIFIALKTNYDKIFLWFIGLASLFYIIEDFRVWPSSDLAKFSEIFIIIPQFVWMYIWLFIVLGITFYNLRMLLKKW